jgi:beta-N-acetylhexosaminidase
MPQAVRAFISGCSGLALSAEERSFFKHAQPWGLIVFKRNVSSPEQLRSLTDEFRNSVGRKDAPVLVDQEGGRVQRLGPSTGNWRAYPSARALGDLYQKNPVLGLRVARHVGLLMAEDLLASGLTVSCMPVLDLPVANVTEAIGSRTYAARPEAIIAMALAHVSGLAAGGILPVMKHLPGHGRAIVDSHLELPLVTAELGELNTSDFVPFAAFAHLPMAMTAHVVFSALDKKNPATHSKRIISKIIREQLGFEGLLMSDDLSMQALQGTIEHRAAAARDAGCEIVLHCNGVMPEMEAVANVVGPLKGKSMRRARVALKSRQKPVKFDRKKALADLELLNSTT